MKFINPPTNRILRHQITHNLRMPVATLQSRSQLHAVIQRLKDDPITGALPNIAWIPVDTLAIHMGQLSLRNPQQIALAIELLNNFNVKSCLGENNAVPLSVDLRGLHSSVPGEQRPLTHRLYTSLSNPATISSLLRLKEGLKALFRKQDLLVTNAADPDDHQFIPHLKLMTTIYLNSDQKNKKPSLRPYNCLRRPVFDARDLFEAYKDYVFTENIRLEKICLTDLGLQDFVKSGKVVGTGYRSLSSIPLPGASNEVISWEDPEVRYVPAAIVKRWKNPVTPLIIPSNSHPIAVDSPND